MRTQRLTLTSTGWQNQNAAWHRLHGPQEFDDQWYFNNRIRRLNGPAYSFDWYQNGLDHRLNGQADIETRSGWYLDGIRFRFFGET